MERGAPTVQAPIEEVMTFFATYSTELRWQSFFFVASGAVSLWFYGALRSFLARHEGGEGRLALVAFTAGVTGAILQFVMQSVQLALAFIAGSGLEPGITQALGLLAFLMTVVAYLPAALLYLASGLVGLRHGALPGWLAWLSLATGLVHVVMSLGLVVDAGPLVPGAPPTYLLYLLALVWLPSVTTVMVLRLGGADVEES